MPQQTIQIWRKWFKYVVILLGIYFVSFSVRTKPEWDLKIQYEMQQQHIRIDMDGVENDSEEKATFITEKCWSSPDERFCCLSGIPNSTFCLMWKVLFFILFFLFLDRIKIYPIFLNRKECFDNAKVEDKNNSWNT